MQIHYLCILIYSLKIFTINEKLCFSVISIFDSANNHMA